MNVKSNQAAQRVEVNLVLLSKKIMFLYCSWESVKHMLNYHKTDYFEIIFFCVYIYYFDLSNSSAFLSTTMNHKQRNI
jgi:hypothetical protein